MECPSVYASSTAVCAVGQRGEMRITYDSRADAAYIYLVEFEAGAVARTYACDPRVVNGEINLDFSADGRLLGIEILDGSRLLPNSLLGRAASS
jgi:uncharacterized protein YuzE